MVLKPLLNKGHRFNRLEQRLFYLAFLQKKFLGVIFFTLDIIIQELISCFEFVRLTVVNLTLVDLPGLTKVAVGSF